MAWPPTWFSASTTITEAPASRAAMAAGKPVAPEPITTTSASRSQFIAFVISSHSPDCGRETNSIADFVSLGGAPENEDRAMPDIVATHRVTHEESLKMLAAGVAKAAALGCKVSLAVVDQSCRLIAFLMMDGARHFSIITTQRKAITAASQRLPTGYAPEENALSMAVRMGDFTNVPGGFPIEINGEVIGAVAAGGAKIELDVEVAKAALAALATP